MEKKDINVLEQMQNMTVDLNSKVLIEKAEKDGVETMYKVQKLQEDFAVLTNIQ